MNLTKWICTQFSAHIEESIKTSSCYMPNWLNSIQIMSKSRRNEFTWHTITMQCCTQCFHIPLAIMHLVDEDICGRVQTYVSNMYSLLFYHTPNDVYIMYNLCIQWNSERRQRAAVT